MSQDFVVTLLRQINSSLSVDARKVPDEIPGLSFAQIYLLSKLFELDKIENQPISLSDLAQETGFSKATVCATLKKLRRSGYIQTQMDDADNRRKEIVLTRKAWQATTSIAQYISSFNHALCVGIPQKDLQTTEKSLRMVLQNAKKVREQNP